MQSGASPLFSFAHVKAKSVHLVTGFDWLAADPNEVRGHNERESKIT